MPGEPDPLYIRARAVLLDATEALGAHLNAVVLVGAQAIYLHTGDADLAVAEYTTDADFTIDPTDLADAPLIADLMKARGFMPHEHLGRWVSPDGVFVDLMVPEALAGPGNRGARLKAHGKLVARRAKGLEATLVDRDTKTVGAMDPTDDRSATMNVAGPGALLVAKIHKIAERTGSNNRIKDKDSLDVLRLLQAIETEDLAARLHRLRSDGLSTAVTSEAIKHLPSLFGHTNAVGIEMVVRATAPDAKPDFIAASMTALVEELLAEL